MFWMAHVSASVTANTETKDVVLITLSIHEDLTYVFHPYEALQ